ncbi:MAG: hypothetical protein J2P52_14570 [Blastocatellia bacterium]|nr:hypothetical protein [Blastocatellia bacterium]
MVLGALGDKRAVPALLASLEQAQSQSRQTEMKLWAGIGLLGLKHPQRLATVVEYLRAEHSSPTFVVGSNARQFRYCGALRPWQGR